MKDIHIRYKTHVGGGGDSHSFEVWGTSAMGPERLAKSGSRYELLHECEAAANRALVRWRDKYPEPAPPVECKPRLTINKTTGRPAYHVWLDDHFLCTFTCSTEDKARAAAQAYVDELKAHFREGGT